MDDKKTQSIHLDALQFRQSIESLQSVADQLSKARDDSYHRARAEAERDAYLAVVKGMYNSLLDKFEEQF